MYYLERAACQCMLKSMDTKPVSRGRGQPPNKEGHTGRAYPHGLVGSQSVLRRKAAA